MSFVCLLPSPPRSSSVSVVFDIIDSLNDVAPVSPILHPVIEKRKKRVNWWWMSFVCLLSFVFTVQTEFSECCVWFQHFAQWCCSCVSNLVVCWCDDKWKTVNCWWMSFVSFFRIHISDIVYWVLCLISTPHTMMLLLCLQSHCLLMLWETESDLLMDVFCAFFLVFSPYRSSSVSVVFDFNASLNDFTPASPMLLSVDVRWK